jgi:alkanesulfonate monooxygenase SsuD/methylene tetrahydromethanopterin reductase-like flavin-dependent oxidoreductase (luciferase family)
MRRLWSEDDVEHEGRYFRVEQGNIRPKPVQPGGVPVYYAGRVERMLDRVPEIADGWIAGSHYTLDEFLSGVRRIRERAGSVGRDPGSIGFARVQDISVHADRETARRRAHAHWGRYYGPQHDVEAETTFGTPDECREQLRRFGEAKTESVDMVLEPASLDLEELQLLREVTQGLG